MVVIYEHITSYVQSAISSSLNQATKEYVLKYDAFYKWSIGKHSVKEIIENGVPEKMNDYIERQTQLLNKAIEDYLDQKKTKRKFEESKVQLIDFNNDEWHKIRMKFQELKNDEYIKSVLHNKKKSIRNNESNKANDNFELNSLTAVDQYESEDSLINFEIINEKYITDLISKIATEFIQSDWKILVLLSNRSDDQYIMMVKNDSEPDTPLDSLATTMKLILKKIAREIDISSTKGDGSYFIKGSFKIK